MTYYPDNQEQIAKSTQFVQPLLAEMRKVIVGQDKLMERLLIGLLTGGHLLLEGLPGLAKTLSAKTLAQCVQANFRRVQFTPDLLPADIVGTLIYDYEQKTFKPHLGPIFTHFLLADEINRAPAKVQSALLEAMQERQVTIGDKSYSLEKPFIVIATQNPIEHEGTYPLPEAQMDRFLMKIKIGYPSKEEEQLIISASMAAETPVVKPVISVPDLFRAIQDVHQVYVDDKIKQYVVDVVHATRFPEQVNLRKLRDYIQVGASPRASISLIQASRAHAFIHQRGYVTPEDVKAVGKDVLRHRIIPTFEAESENRDSDVIIDTIFSEIEVP